MIGSFSEKPDLEVHSKWQGIVLKKWPGSRDNENALGNVSMAKLLNCKECGREVSRTAKTCPNCGAKMSRQRTSATTWMLAIIFGFLIYSTFSTNQPSTSNPSASLKTPSGSAAPSVQEPTWSYWHSQDKLTDEDVHYAHFKAKKGWLYNVESWVRCKTKKKEFDIFFEVGEFIGSGDFETGMVKVEYRFDAAPISIASFHASTDGTNIFVPTSKVSEFVSGMVKGNRLRLRVYDYEGTAHDAEIPLKGTATTIPKVVEACS